MRQSVAIFLLNTKQHVPGHQQTKTRLVLTATRKRSGGYKANIWTQKNLVDGSASIKLIVCTIDG